MRTPRRFVAALGLLAFTVVGAASCWQDQDDPKFWAAKLDDWEQEQRALDRIAEIHVDRARAVVPDLIKLYRTTGKAPHLEALVRYHDPRARPLFLEALAGWQEKPAHALIAVRAFGDEHATDVADKLRAIVETPLPRAARGNEIRLEALRMLIRLGDRRVHSTLLRLMETPRESQDFRLHQRAAEGLAAQPEASDVGFLVRGLFLGSGGKATTFEPCRLALARIGKPAIPPLLELLASDDETVAAAATRFEIEVGPAFVRGAAAVVLGDLRAVEAIPALAARLHPFYVGPESWAVIRALGLIGTPAATEPLIAYLRDPCASPKVRVEAAEALALSGDELAAPVLLEVARTGFLPTEDGGRSSFLRLNAAVGLARIARPPELAALRALVTPEIPGEPAFKEVLERVALGEICGDAVPCYAKHLADESVPRAEKAAYALALSGDRAALAPLVEALGLLASTPAARYPVQRAILFGLGRLGDRGCTACLEKLRRQLAVDERLVQDARALMLVREAGVTLAYLEHKQPAPAAR